MIYWLRFICAFRLDSGIGTELSTENPKCCQERIIHTKRSSAQRWSSSPLSAKSFIAHLLKTSVIFAGLTDMPEQKISIKIEIVAVMDNSMMNRHGNISWAATGTTSSGTEPVYPRSNLRRNSWKTSRLIQAGIHRGRQCLWRSYRSSPVFLMQSIITAKKITIPRMIV